MNVREEHRLQQWYNTE